MRQYVKIIECTDLHLMPLCDIQQDNNGSKQELWVLGNMTVLTNHICILYKWHVVAIQSIGSQVRFNDNMLNS